MMGIKRIILRFFSAFQIRICIRSTFFGTFYESAFHIPNADPVPEGTNADPVPEGTNADPVSEGSKSAKSKRINKT
jgi:hypothetical protein